MEDESRRAPRLHTHCIHYIVLFILRMQWHLLGRGGGVGAVSLTLQPQQKVQLLDFCSSNSTGLHIYYFIILFYDCNMYCMIVVFIFVVFTFVPQAYNHNTYPSCSPLPMSNSKSSSLPSIIGSSIISVALYWRSYTVQGSLDFQALSLHAYKFDPLQFVRVEGESLEIEVSSGRGEVQGTFAVDLSRNKRSPPIGGPELPLPYPVPHCHKRSPLCITHMTITLAPQNGSWFTLRMIAVARRALTASTSYV